MNMTILPPVWLTPPGTLGTIAQNVPFSGLVVQAQDPQGLLPVFSILNGALPPGITLSSIGIFTGIMTQISQSSQIFTFTVRVTNGFFDIDRQFSLIGISPTSVPAWNFNGFPPISNNPFPHYDLATLDLGSIFTFSLDIVVTHLETIVIDVLPIPNVTIPSNAFNGLLPPGLTLHSFPRRIAGFTTFDAINAGIYYFRLSLSNVNDPSQTMPPPVDCSITLTSNISDNFQTPTNVIFVNSFGSLGELIETYPSYFTVKARTIVGSNVALSYTLSPSSGPLPSGLSLNATSGEIRGIAGFVGVTTTFFFTIRASNGNSFADGVFSITVRSRFNIGGIHDFRCILLGPQRVEWSNFYTNVISSAVIFRLSDPDFGFPIFPTIYIVKGIQLTSTATLLQALNDGLLGPLDDFHHDLSVYLGEHKVAVARDFNNKPLYEVLYREIIDPQAGGGGFSFASDIAVEQPVVYPESRTNPTHITTVFPNSFRNLRLDLITDLGLAGNGPFATLPGPSGVEGMPLWMMSRQIADDPNSIIGYVPAVEIVYLNVGQGVEVLKSLRGTRFGNGQTQDSFLRGRKVSLDRYVVDTLSNFSFLGFDDGKTTFDVPTTFPLTSFDNLLFSLDDNKTFFDGNSSITESLFDSTLEFDDNTTRFDTFAPGPTQFDDGLSSTSEVTKFFEFPHR